MMASSVPILLVPGLLCSARLYAPQIPALWPFGQVAVADHRRDADMAAIAARILKDAPPRFALVGLSMGGYIAFAMLRLASERIVRLALLDTSARPDTPEQTAGRKTQIAMAQAGRFGEIPELSIPRFLHRNRQNDAGLTAIVRQMAQDTGPEAFVRQQNAIMTRPDSRPLLASIRCPTLVLVGDGDEATPPELNKEIAGGISGAKLVVVPECGHLSTLEKPEVVNAALADWLTFKS
jgi:pimeloyl-ACP methyl ester carboxylesterase